MLVCLRKSHTKVLISIRFNSDKVIKHSIHGVTIVWLEGQRSRPSWTKKESLQVTSHPDTTVSLYGIKDSTPLVGFFWVSLVMRQIEADEKERGENAHSALREMPSVRAAAVSSSALVSTVFVSFTTNVWVHKSSAIAYTHLLTCSAAGHAVWQEQCHFKVCWLLYFFCWISFFTNVAILLSTVHAYHLSLVCH